jgi:uroporphyrinogen-III synthase
LIPSGRPTVAPTLIVTRPEPQCSAWVARLQVQGQPACALPLLRIEAVAEFAAALDAAWAALAHYRLVMFVSPNAVERFCARRPPGRIWPAATLAAATGPGTVAALQAQGVPAEAIVAPAADSAQFDADTLWTQQLAHRAWAGARTLIVRGEAGRDWLARTLQAHGAKVELLAAYRQAPPLWTPGELRQLDALLAAPDEHAWLFSSSQAVRHLLAAVGTRGEPALAALRRMTVLATHPRIAETALQAGLTQVSAVRPEIETIVAALRQPLYTMTSADCPSSLPSS